MTALRFWIGFAIAGLLAWMMTASAALATETPLVDTPHVQAQMVTDYDVVTPGQEIHIALRTIIEDKWHTYWRNPGDSGEPVRIDWDTGIAAGEIIWPIPDAIPFGDVSNGLTNYGFEGDVLFPVPVTVPLDLKAGDIFTVSGIAGWLVCYDVCIPGEMPFSLDITVGERSEISEWSSVIDAAIRIAPADRGTIGGGSFNGQQFQWQIVEGAAARDITKLHFFPYDDDVVAPASPQNFVFGTKGIAGATEAGYGLETPFERTITGVLTYWEGGRHAGEIVTLLPNADIDIGEIVSGAMDTDLTPFENTTTLWGAVLFAFLGGMILNLMPCVFPILSMKALGFARLAHSDKKKIRRHGWVYTFGVLVAFAILTGILVILKNIGMSLGWGFQLQNPVVIGLLILLIFAIGLNLLGMFEVGTRLQNVGGELTEAGGATGTFFTGLLAVIVATPCMAPFMSVAIGFALAKPIPILIAVFVALAIGFALPFLLLSYAPGILKRLPAPGPWMVRFKEFLAFPMFATGIWLLWVLMAQTSDMSLVLILSAMLLLAFGIWFLKQSGVVHRALGIVAIAAALALPFFVSEAETEAPRNAWSTEAVQTLRADGQAVFVDFTAAWCITCKVNERRVLSQPDIKKVFQDTNTAFLVADWTKRDDAIAQELALYGRAGVPLYLYFPPGNNPVSPTILPQFLSKTVVVETLEGSRNP